MTPSSTKDDRKILDAGNEKEGLERCHHREQVVELVLEAGAGAEEPTKMNKKTLANESKGVRVERQPKTGNTSKQRMPPQHVTTTITTVKELLAIEEGGRPPRTPLPPAPSPRSASTTATSSATEAPPTSVPTEISPPAASGSRPVLPPPALQRGRDVLQVRESTPGAFRMSGTSQANHDHDESWNQDHSWNAHEDLIVQDLEGGLAVGSSGVVEAVPVKDEHAQRAEIEQEVRKSILEEAVQASELVREQHKVDRTFKQKHKLLTCFLLVLVALAIALGLGLELSQSDRKSDQQEGRPAVEDFAACSPVEVDQDTTTLDLIRERGYVLCGISDMGLVYTNSEGQLEGLGVDYCRAMALAALWDATKFEVVRVTPKTRFQMLDCGLADVLTDGVTHTMGRDLYEKTTMKGYTFTVPIFYTGLSFAGVPEYVACAENQEDFDNNCSDLRVCVGEGTTHHDALPGLLSGGVFVPVQDLKDLATQWQQGACNTVAGLAYFLLQAKQQFGGDHFIIGERILTRQPLSLVTRQTDPKWSALANTVVNALIYGEAHDSLSGNGADLEEGNELVSLLVSLTSEFDTGEAETSVTQTSLNSIYDASSKSSGLLYSAPFGDIEASPKSPQFEAKLHRTINQSGQLVCGVLPHRGPEFALRTALTTSNSTEYEWSGFDVEWCKGLAASLFRDVANKVVFVQLQNETESYNALANGHLDVVAGARLTMQAMYKEPTTSQGFVFSSPYFYDTDSGDAFGFMTSQEDPQWSTVVYWMVMAVIHAEEKGIKASNSPELPVVLSFGQHNIKQLLRDGVYQVGNYADLYKDTLEEFMPRSGANLLNDGAGPLMYPIPLT